MGMPTPDSRPRKRHHADDDIASLPPLLTAEQTLVLADTIKSHREVLLDWLSNEKSTDRKAKLLVAINEFCDCYNKLSSAYLDKIATDLAMDSCQSVFNEACTNIKQTSSMLSDLPLVSQNAATAPQPSFASVVREQAKRVIHPDKVTLDSWQTYTDLYSNACGYRAARHRHRKF